MSKQLTLSSVFAIVAMAGLALSAYAGVGGNALASPSGAAPFALTAAFD